MKVKNKKCIFNLSCKSMKATKLRNTVAVIAIALTTLLFTSLFTILASLLAGIEQTKFVQAGTMSHGTFKQITEEQFDVLKDADEIAEYGVQRILGTSSGGTLQGTKSATVLHMDKNAMEWTFATLEAGRLPAENTSEAVADTRVLSALGVPLEEGTEFSMDINVGGTLITETFTLCGWWKPDGAVPSRYVIIPESRLTQISEKHGISDQKHCSMMFMLKDATNISGTVEAIISKYGFSSLMSADNYIATSINWAHFESLNFMLDTYTLITLSGLILVFMLAGYLIIYNVFKISVANEIRHYGMLKTIGTTGKQIRNVVITQAMILSLFGIPLGLICGWGVGAILTPIIRNEFNIMDSGVSVSPVIAIFSVVFAFVTVLISCFRPAKIASSTSPIEALRYVEPKTYTNRREKKSRGISIPEMVKLNLTGNKGKTAVTLLSLALSVVIFIVTLTFANSFSLEKYISGVTTDFIISSTDYFGGATTWTSKTAMSKAELTELSSVEGITAYGVSYGLDFESSPFLVLEEEFVREKLKAKGVSAEHIDTYIADQRGEDGLIQEFSLIQGADTFCLDKLQVIDGDIAKLYNGGNYIAVSTDSMFDVGDTIPVRYTDSLEFIDTNTNEVIVNIAEITEAQAKYIRADRQTHDEEYIVVAKVETPWELGYRYFGGEYIIMNNDILLRNAAEDAAPIFCAFDVAAEYEASAEKFIQQYAQSNSLGYESMATTVLDFESTKKMFVTIGVVLSFVVGLIGVLNFVNTLLASVNSRRKELATLQAIGMSGKQLIHMLICESLMYTIGAALIAVMFTLLTFIPVSTLITDMFWFCDYRFTFLPVAIIIPVFALIGVIVPILIYRTFTKKSLTERLREVE